MRRTVLQALLFNVIAVSSAGCDGAPACVPGQSASCICTTGEPGAQVCEDDGTYGDCVCSGEDGGPSADAGLRADASADTDAEVRIDGGIRLDAAGVDASVGGDAGPIEGVVDLAATWYRTCVVHSDGRTLCWGGEPGVSARDCPVQPVPTTVAALTDVHELAIAFYHSCARRGVGQVVCWGEGREGELGDGRAMSSEAPVTATGIADARQIATGDNHSCVLRSDASVWCWGRNTDGQIGTGGVGDQVDSPSRVMGVSNAEQIAAASNYSCARLDDGTIRCWGSNFLGRLGNGSTADGTGIPSEVVGIDDATDVSAGLQHACALRSDRTVWCWGAAGEGRLGNGSTSDSPVPVQVTGIDDAVDVGAFGVHSCVLRASGGLSCWGRGDRGQLGDGELIDRAVPVDVASISGSVVQIAGGHFHTCASTSAGELFCWGGSCGASGSPADEPLPQRVTIP